MGVVMRMVWEDLGRVRRLMAWGRPAEVRGGGDVWRKVLYVLCDEWMDGRLKQEVRT